VLPKPLIASKYDVFHAGSVLFKQMSIGSIRNLHLKLLEAVKCQAVDVPEIRYVCALVNYLFCNSFDFFCCSFLQVHCNLNSSRICQNDRITQLEYCSLY
jgi:hypothetical protein